MRPILRTFCIAVSLAAVTALPAAASDRFVAVDRYGYGFAGEAVGGDYVGAPLARFPRPNEIVPPAWGYGTYGVPTVTGIRQAPTAAPTLTVIDTSSPARMRGRSLSRRSDTRWDGGTRDGWQFTGVRVISVTVPRR